MTRWQRSMAQYIKLARMSCPCPLLSKWVDELIKPPRLEEEMAQTWIPPCGECLCFLSFLLPCDECPFLWFINLFLQIEWPHLKVEISSNMFDDWINDIGLRSILFEESWDVEGLSSNESSRLANSESDTFISASKILQPSPASYLILIVHKVEQFSL